MKLRIAIGVGTSQCHFLEEGEDSAGHGLADEETVFTVKVDKDCRKLFRILDSLDKEGDLGINYLLLNLLSEAFNQGVRYEKSKK